MPWSGHRFESGYSLHAHLKGVRLVVSRQSLKLASGVRFAHPLPLAAGGVPSGPGSAPRSDRGGSRFEAWAASQSSAGIVQWTGWNATNVQIEVRLLIPVPGFWAGRPIAQDAALPTLKLGLESPLADQFLAVMAERLRRLIVDQDQVGSTPTHRATGVSSNWQGSLAFNQRMRDRDPPPLPNFGLSALAAKHSILNRESTVRACDGPPGYSGLAKLATRLAVNQEMCRFESCPQKLRNLDNRIGAARQLHPRLNLADCSRAPKP